MFPFFPLFFRHTVERGLTCPRVRALASSHAFAFLPDKEVNKITFEEDLPVDDFIQLLKTNKVSLAEKEPERWDARPSFLRRAVMKF